MIRLYVACKKKILQGLAMVSVRWVKGGLVFEYAEKIWSETSVAKCFFFNRKETKFKKENTFFFIYSQIQQKHWMKTPLSVLNKT